MSSLVIAAPSRLAADTGAEVAEAGGSVVDAAVAAALVAMCSEPGVCAPGGGGFLTVWPADEEPVSVDGYMAMPGIDLPPGRDIVTRQVAMEYGGGTITEVGPGSIAVPGALAAFDVAHRRWGTLPWPEVIERVADALADGFPLSTACAYYLSHSAVPVFSHDPASRAALFAGDRPLRAGDTVYVPELVDTLRRIGTEGASDLFRGDLAAAIVSDLAERGSRLTAADLASYRPNVQPPLVSRLGEWTMATTPAPAVGGITLTGILRLIVAGPDPSGPQTWAEAQQRVFQHRHLRLETAPDRSVAGDQYLAELRPSASTISVSVAGADGTVCATTMSAGYGSGVVPRGTGLWMNNSLGEMELNPPGLASSPVGSRLMSNMAPTVAAGPAARLAVGSPGADRITSALGITLSLLVAGYELEAAVEHPRLHVDTTASTLSLEPGLEARLEGFRAHHYPHRDMFFGGVTAAAWTPDRLVAHADTRRSGAVTFAG